jgi:UDP-2-acetamido-3-amino-2,3-dideoxy-glucuronate N-acetyltransferase
VARKKRSLGLIGAGAWGKNLARNFEALGVLHSLCDNDASKLDGYRHSYRHVKRTTDPQELLDNKEITRIAIATPPEYHYELTKEALLRGKDVYVEKPLCLDYHHGEHLVELAKERGRLLMVGHILQYHPCVRRLQDLLRNGDLGRLQYIVSNRLNLGMMRTHESSLWCLAPHDVSVVLSLCGNHLPEEVRCVGGDYLTPGVADCSVTTLKLPDGVRAHVHVSWLHPFKEQKLTVIGSSGMAVFDDTKPWEQKLMLRRGCVKWIEGVSPVANDAPIEYMQVEQLEPLREECAHFIECCDSRQQPRTDGVEGLQVLKVLRAAQASMQDEGSVKDPEFQHQLTLHKGGSLVVDEEVGT